MKTISILLFLVFCLCGCCQTKYVDIPVYQPVSFDMPKRPLLISNGQQGFDRASKDIETDFLSVVNYAIGCENLLIRLKTQKQ